jgi:uncharacterized protein YicC (UPF0701 family)
MKFLDWLKKDIFEISDYTLMRESFDSPVQYSIAKAENLGTSKAYHGIFKVQDKQFLFVVEKLSDEKAMLINFWQVIASGFAKTTEYLNNLSKKEALAVFSTMKKVFDDFSYDVDIVELQATSQKKFSIYKKMANLQNSEWSMTSDIAEKEIYLTRKKVNILKDKIKFKFKLKVK